MQEGAKECQGLRRWETRNTDPPLDPPQGTSPADTLSVAQGD